MQNPGNHPLGHDAHAQEIHHRGRQCVKALAGVGLGGAGTRELGQVLQVAQLVERPLEGRAVPFDDAEGVLPVKCVCVFVCVCYVRESVCLCVCVCVSEESVGSGD